MALSLLSTPGAATVSGVLKAVAYRVVGGGRQVGSRHCDSHRGGIALPTRGRGPIGERRRPAEAGRGRVDEAAVGVERDGAARRRRLQHRGHRAATVGGVVGQHARRRDREGRVERRGVAVARGRRQAGAGDGDGDGGGVALPTRGRGPIGERRRPAEAGRGRVDEAAVGVERDGAARRRRLQHRGHRAAAVGVVVAEDAGGNDGERRIESGGIRVVGRGRRHAAAGLAVDGDHAIRRNARGQQLPRSNRLVRETL